MNYVILNKDEVIADASDISNREIIIGSDNTALIGYDNIPAKYSSKTAYTRSQVETMMRDSSNTYYLQGF